MKKLLAIMLSIFTLALVTGCDSLGGKPNENPEKSVYSIVHTWYDTDTTYPFVYTFTEDKKVSISGSFEAFVTVTFTAEGTYNFTDAAEMNGHIDISSGTLNGSELSKEDMNAALSMIGLSTSMDFIIDHYEDNKMYVSIAEFGDRILEYAPEYCGTWNVINTSSSSAGLLWKESTGSNDKPDYITLNRDKTFKLEFSNNQAKLIGTYTMNEGKLEFNPLKAGKPSVADEDLGDPELYKKYLETYDYHFGKNFGVLSYYDDSKNHFMVFQKENAEAEVYTDPAKNKDLVGRYVAITKGVSTFVTYTYVFKSNNSYTASTDYVTTASNGLKYTLTVTGSYSVSNGKLSLKPDDSKTVYKTNAITETPFAPAEPSRKDVTYTVQTGDSTLKITDLNKLFYKF